MQSNLMIFNGPKNSGKTLKAKEIALDYNENELIFVSEPLYEVDKILIYFNKFVNKNTKLIVIDDIRNIFFLFNIMFLYKYKKSLYKARNINIILICDENIDEKKVVKLAVNHKIDCHFLNFPL
jgi:hypothetical protein